MNSVFPWKQSSYGLFALSVGIVPYLSRRTLRRYGALTMRWKQKGQGLDLEAAYYFRKILVLPIVVQSATQRKVRKHGSRVK